jgi:acetamidase/formamidase
MATAYSVDHRIGDGDDTVHLGYWDNTLEPARTVDTGDVVQFECRDSTNNHFHHQSTVADLATKPDHGHPLTGPVRIEGAEPGDVLVVEILDLEHEGFGVSYFYPGEVGKGLLPGEFEEPGLHTWELEGDVGHFLDGIEVPLDPFPGIVGLAPAEPGEHSSIPPRRVGGNLDVKHLTAGSTLYLPVAVDGALCSIGDCHGAQGDGEVCVTAIEAPMTVTVRFDLRKDRDLAQPRFETGGPFGPAGPEGPALGMTGIGDDLLGATKRAVGQMIDYLHAERGLTRPEAYILCSAAVDLKINQVVNEPNWTVSAYLSAGLFPD